MKYSTTAGSKVKFSFTGRHAAIVTTVGPDRGTVEVWVDGAHKYDLWLGNSSTLRVRKRVPLPWTSWSSSGSHTIELRTTSNKRVDVDAFVKLYRSGLLMS